LETLKRAKRQIRKREINLKIKKRVKKKKGSDK